MQYFSLRSLFCLLTLGVSLNIHAADIQIPDTFESTKIEGTDASSFIKKCIPLMSDSTITKTLKNATDKNNLIISFHPDVLAYLAITAGQEYCIALTEKKYPILPLSAFEDTIRFNDMPKDQSSLLWTDISRQLAKNGVATALIMNETGSANLISYLIASENPSKLYYQRTFLKKDEFTESAYPNTYKTSGGVSVISRGASRENVKFLFSTQKLPPNI